MDPNMYYPWCIFKQISGLLKPLADLCLYSSYRVRFDWFMRFHTSKKRPTVLLSCCGYENLPQTPWFKQHTSILPYSSGNRFVRVKTSVILEAVGRDHMISHFPPSLGCLLSLMVAPSSVFKASIVTSSLLSDSGSFCSWFSLSSVATAYRSFTPKSSGLFLVLLFVLFMLHLWQLKRSSIWTF